jgi:hypothetical protein
VFVVFITFLLKPKFPYFHCNLGFFVLFSQPARPILATLTEWTAARPLAVRARVVSPTYYLRENFCPMNFRLPDAPGNNDLVSFLVLASGHQRRGFSGGHLLV